MLIITGHGNFGSGMKSSLDIIVGNYDFIKVIDFEEGKSPEELKKELKYMCDNSDDRVFIFTDLLGGTPFKVSSELKLENENIDVICGTNLAMLVETTMMMAMDMNINCEAIKEAGVNAIKSLIKKVSFDGEGI